MAQVIGSGSKLQGGWVVQDEKSTDIIGLGRFAVDKYNNENYKQLAFNEVTNAEEKTLNERNYRLTISVDDEDDEFLYEALVVRPGKVNHIILGSFAKLK